MKRKASAEWQGDLKSGKGTVSSESGVLAGTPYSFSTRFESVRGTNPEELIAAAHAAGETALFLGLVIPGELVVILGGALASRSRVPLAGILAAGILGPITGDSIGYFLGRRYGRRFLRRKRMEKWARARQWLRKRGA